MKPDLNPPVPLWVSVKHTAKMLSVSDRQIYYLVERGELPGVKFGRAIRIPLGALTRWMADKEQEAEEERRIHDSNT